MSLLLIDGFDHYATADITKKWTVTNTGASIASSTGRRSTGCLTCQKNGTGYVTKTLAAAGASFVMGVAVKMVDTLPAAAMPILSLLDAGTAQCELRCNTDGTLSVTRGGASLTNGTSTATIALGAFAYIEWMVTIADSIGAGTCKVRINGTDVITVATGQDLKDTVNASANQVRVGAAGNSGNDTVLFDDFYICDTAGSTNNSFLGDVRVDTVLPTGDGNYTAFTPSTGVSHFALVDESTPNTSDYNDGASASDRDSYTFADLPSLSGTVYGLQINAAILKDDAGARSAGVFARSSATDGDGAGVALSTSQLYISTVFETNPNGSVAWTESTVNAAEFGVLVTA